MGVEPSEVAGFPSPSGFRDEPLAARPGLYRSDRRAQKARERARRQAAEVSRPLAGPRHDFEQQVSARSDEGLRLAQESFAMDAREPEGVTEDRDVRERAQSERRRDAVPPNELRARPEVLAHAKEHLPREVQRDPLRVGGPDFGEKPTRSGSDVDDPSTRGDVPAEEPDSQRSEEFALSRAFVPLPL